MNLEGRLVLVESVLEAVTKVAEGKPTTDYMRQFAIVRRVEALYGQSEAHTRVMTKLVEEMRDAVAERDRLWRLSHGEAGALEGQGTKDFAR